MRKARRFAPLRRDPGAWQDRTPAFGDCAIPVTQAVEAQGGTPAPQVAVRLVLLGSPPDTVHGAALRGTDPSSLLTWGRQHNAVQGAGIHPCCSGLQVQGTANSPTSAALPQAGRLCAVRRKAVFDIIHHFPPFINITFHFFKKVFNRINYIISECPRQESFILLSTLYGPIKLSWESMQFASIRKVISSIPIRSTIHKKTPQ